MDPIKELVTVNARVGTLVGDKWHSVDQERGSILLLHGGGQRRHSWKRTGEWLARDGWTAYAFDARGHGDSAWAADSNYTVSALVEDLFQLIGVIGEPPVLVGASMGAMTSLIAEGEHKGTARALVLVDMVVRQEPEGVARIHKFMRGAPDGFANLEEAADAIAAYNPHRPRPSNLEGLRRNLRLNPNGRWYWHWDPAFLKLTSEPERDVGYERTKVAAQSIQVPTLLVRGVNSDIVSVQGLREMQELMPHARAAEVSAGHMIAGDDNNVFTSQLSTFLTQSKL